MQDPLLGNLQMTAFTLQPRQRFPRRVTMWKKEMTKSFFTIIHSFSISENNLGIFSLFNAIALKTKTNRK